MKGAIICWTHICHQYSLEYRDNNGVNVFGVVIPGANVGQKNALDSLLNNYQTLSGNEIEVNQKTIAIKDSYIDIIDIKVSVIYDQKYVE